jgi:lycopene cyclase domain-containing protein
MNCLYLLINTASVTVPFIFSFHHKLQFNKKWKYILPAIIISAIFFITWDVYFTHTGVWGFNADYLLGIYFYNLPIEELLFFICIPYSCVFTYHCLNILLKKNHFQKVEHMITWLLLTCLSTVAILNYDKLYTFVTFTLLALFLFSLKFVWKVNWLSRFYFSYSILLIPFLIVNGILTGTGLDEPVVWYNNNENLQIRILTIPLEDVFYGMFLILLNVSVYEYFSRKNAA